MINEHKPWLNEPNSLAFDYKGYKAFILRNKIGALCGYVRMPTTHPDYEKDKKYYQYPYEVHGGITYGELATLKKTGEEFYFIGFDCGHATDIIPEIEHTYNSETSQINALLEEWQSKRSYKTIEFVTDEIKSLIDQIIERENYV